MAAVGPESFHVANWFHSRTKRMQQFESLIALLDWSTLVHYDNEKTSVVAERFMMANAVTSLLTESKNRHMSSSALRNNNII